MSFSLYGRLIRRYRPTHTALSRRAFLQTTAAASAALLLSNCKSADNRRAGSATRPSARRVVVIGGGFAGLAAAHELLAAGYDVKVIEARNRVGGRVLSFNNFVPGKNVEGGGELIGSNHPTWVAYAEKFGLEFLQFEETEGSMPIIVGGRKLTDEEGEKLLEEMDEVFPRMNEDARAVNEDEPWLTPNAAVLDARTTAQWLAEIECSDLCRTAVAAELAADNGVSLDKQSYLGNLTQIKGGGVEAYWEESEVMRCKGGNQQLATALASAIGSDRVLLGTPVSAIRLGRNGARVTTASGGAHEADEVILAVPPSVWSRIQFDPRLAELPQMGTNVKYLAHVRDAFWQKNEQIPDSLTTGDVSMTWDGTDNQGDGPRCLVAFSGGPAAEAIRAQTPGSREERYHQELESLYPGFNDAFVGSRFMDWPSERWTGAGYSFPAPGQITTLGPRLHEGVGPLRFAGEHVCYKFVGYMEGALNSGASLARRMAEQHDGQRDASREMQPV